MSYWFDSTGVYPSNGVFYDDMILRPQSVISGISGMSLVDRSDINPSRLGNIHQTPGGLSLEYTNSDGSSFIIAGSTGSSSNATFLVQRPDASVPNAQAVSQILDSNGNAGNVRWSVLGVNNGTTGSVMSLTRLIDTQGSAVENLFLGRGAGNITLTTANQNIGVGEGALDSLTTSNGNLALGANAGTALTTGNGGNIMLGNGAGQNVSTGVSNICVGVNSGAGVSTGTFNIAIGQDTSPGATNNNCICIGHSSSCVDTEPSSIAIGHGAVCNVAGACCINTTDNGYAFGINTALPKTALHVASNTGEGAIAALYLENVDTSDVPVSSAGDGIVYVDTENLKFKNSSSDRFIPFALDELTDVLFVPTAESATQVRLQYVPGASNWQAYIPVKGVVTFQPTTIGGALPTINFNSAGTVVPVTGSFINTTYPTSGTVNWNISMPPTVPGANGAIMSITANGLDSASYVGTIWKVTVDWIGKVSTYPVTGRAGFSLLPQADGSGNAQHCLFSDATNTLAAPSVSFTGYTVGRNDGGTIRIVDIYGISDSISVNTVVSYHMLNVTFERVS